MAALKKSLDEQNLFWDGAGEGGGRGGEGLCEGRRRWRHPGDSAALLLAALNEFLQQTPALQVLYLTVFNDVADEAVDNLIRALNRVPRGFMRLEIRVYGSTAQDLMLLLCGTVRTVSLCLLMRCMDLRHVRDLWDVLNMPEQSAAGPLPQTVELTVDRENGRFPVHDPFPEELRHLLRCHWQKAAVYGHGGCHYCHPTRNWRVGCPA